MKHKLYAFWKHDVPPYVLGGEVTEIKSNGRVCVKGFTGCSFLPLQILPLEEGRAKQKEIDLALKNYKNTIKKAEEELRSHTKQLSLKYTLTEIGHTDTDEDTLLWDILQKHRGHKVSIVSYGDNDAPANIALECEDCGEVILDAGIYTIYARKDS